MQQAPIIALDAMGGDFGPEVVVPAAARLLKEMPEARLILVGLEDRLKEQVSRLGLELNEHLQIQHASEVVAMDLYRGTVDPIDNLFADVEANVRIAVAYVEGRCQIALFVL